MTDLTCRAALAELVAVKDIKERAAALHFAGPSGPLGEGWEAEWKLLEREYMERQPKAWAAARSALAQEAVPPQSVDAADVEAGKAALSDQAYGPLLKNLASPEPFHPQFVSGFWHGHAAGRKRGRNAALAAAPQPQDTKDHP